MGGGWDPHWHQPTDKYETFSDADFRLGLNAAQTTLGGLGVLTGAKVMLRELEISDAASLFAMLTPEEVSRFISPPPTTVMATVWNGTSGIAYRPNIIIRATQKKMMS